MSGSRRSFTRHCASDVEPAVVAEVLQAAEPGWPVMKDYGIPDFSYVHVKFESRVSKAGLAPFENNLLPDLNTLSEGRFFSQKTMEAAWDAAFLKQFEAAHKILARRKPKAEFVEGVRYGQCRAS